MPQSQLRSMACLTTGIVSFHDQYVQNMWQYWYDTAHALTILSCLWKEHLSSPQATGNMEQSTPPLANLCTQEQVLQGSTEPASVNTQMCELNNKWCSLYDPKNIDVWLLWRRGRRGRAERETVMGMNINWIHSTYLWGPYNKTIILYRIHTNEEYLLKKGEIRAQLLRLPEMCMNKSKRHCKADTGVILKALILPSRAQCFCMFSQCSVLWESCKMWGWHCGPFQPNRENVMLLQSIMVVIITILQTRKQATCSDQTASEWRV